MARILVADDKQASTIAAYLRRHDNLYQVDAVETVEDAIRSLEAAARSRVPYDVAVIDMQFDDFSDLEDESACAGMRIVETAIRCPYLEPIVLTGHPSVPTAAESVDKGVFRYLTKASPTWLTRDLVPAVEHAVTMSDLMRVLGECFGELGRFMRLVTTGRADAQAAEEIQVSVRLARQAFDRVLRGRGRMP